MKILLIYMLLNSVCSIQHNFQYQQKPIKEFSLPNVDGKKKGLKSYPDAKGFIIVFTCNHCPFAKLYSRRLNDLHSKYSPLNVPLFAINSMDTLIYEEETFQLMQERAKTEGFLFPYLQDAQQEIGRLFNATHTPQVFVIWKVKGKWEIQYKGPIDDNGADPEKATPFVSIVVDELLTNRPISYTERKAFGCAIHYRK